MIIIYLFFIALAVLITYIVSIAYKRMSNRAKIIFLISVITIVVGSAFLLPQKIAGIIALVALAGFMMIALTSEEYLSDTSYRYYIHRLRKQYLLILAPDD